MLPQDINEVTQKDTFIKYFWVQLGIYTFFDMDGMEIKCKKRPFGYILINLFVYLKKSNPQINIEKYM